MLLATPLFAQDNRDIWDKALDEIERRDPASFNMPEIFIKWLKDEGYTIPQVKNCFPDEAWKSEKEYDNIANGHLLGEDSNDWVVIGSRNGKSQLIIYSEQNNNVEKISEEKEDRNCLQRLVQICYSCSVEPITATRIREFLKEEYLKEYNEKEIIKKLQKADHDGLLFGEIGKPAYLLYHVQGEWKSLITGD